MGGRKGRGRREGEGKEHTVKLSEGKWRKKGNKRRSLDNEKRGNKMNRRRKRKNEG